VTHENKVSIHVEHIVGNKQFSSGFNSNSGVNYGEGPKFNFFKIELKKFDGTKVCHGIDPSLLPFKVE
jgi:hypothetical protein